ncbi:MAG: hypothetical protein ACREK1_13190 [Longimicrobiales bacterium]
MVVRLLVGLPETQLRRRRIESAYATDDTVVISDLVIAETLRSGWMVRRLVR